MIGGSFLGAGVFSEPVFLEPVFLEIRVVAQLNLLSLLLRTLAERKR